MVGVSIPNTPTMQNFMSKLLVQVLHFPFEALTWSSHSGSDWTKSRKIRKTPKLLSPRRRRRSEEISGVSRIGFPKKDGSTLRPQQHCPYYLFGPEVGNMGVRSGKLELHSWRNALTVKIREENCFESLSEQEGNDRAFAPLPGHVAARYTGRIFILLTRLVA